ncbi:AAA family ATPase [uncultured Rhodoblastus sp.]|uniref:AAA family ATPase n=1 Tax=uncultured Rhodoblastus sp. TaxID=543037 RepID=UPI0025E87182|nr:AAA family ATPase [uncultured Rhodoblastus sp.]
MNDRAPVIAVAGIPGAGKSALVSALASRMAAQVVEYDQFQTLTRMSVREIEDWFRRGGDPNEFALIELIDELTRRTLKSGTEMRAVVLFETPFGRLHRGTGGFIDLLVWVDTPFDVALSRAMLAAIEMFSRQNASGQASEFLAWQRQYLLNYPILRDMYLAQHKAIIADAELIVDGRLTTLALADLVVGALRQRSIPAYTNRP